MKIKKRLLVLFTCITAIILLLFASMIYWTASADREVEFYNLLEKEAITKANLFLNAQVDQKILQDIYRNNRQILDEVEVAIYDPQFDLLYHDAVDIDFVKETQEMIDKIKQQDKLKFYQSDYQVIGLQYQYEGRQYIITAAAYDQYGYKKLEKLLNNSIILFVISILLIPIAGVYFTKQVFEPIRTMIYKVKAISANNLDLRLPNSQNKDELSELAHTFNQMLDRLESSFDAQKQFVSNISHELRTPLSAIITELELAINQERQVDQYKTAIRLALTDSKKLAKLSNSLLDLAKASYDPSEIAMKTLRIDEVLIDARQQIQKRMPLYHISIHFEEEIENESQILVRGNAYLLEVAFVNLLENACKFSPDHQCKVKLLSDNQHLVLKFIDQGVGISSEDQPHIFDTFYRCSSPTKQIDGHGIGLSLTHKIIGLHQGSIQVESVENKETTFTVKLPIA